MSDQENNTPTEATTEVTNEQPTAENKTAPAAEGQPQVQPNVLLGAISYTDDAAFDKFLLNMDLNQAIFVLLSAANNAQAKGVYNLEESELISRAIKTIKRNTTTAPQVANAEVQPESDSSTSEASE